MKIIVDIAGGFGNQLFCYCFGYALARKKSAELIIDTSTQDNGLTRRLELLNLNVSFDRQISCLYKRQFLERAVLNKVRKRISIGLTTRIYNEKYPTVYEEAVLRTQKDTYFKGNWQTEKYFEEYRSDLLKMLTPKQDRSDSVKRLCSEMKRCNSVALHIRRGDYLEIGCQLNMEYYQKAICKMKDILQKNDLVFYIFSDDIAFCKDYFQRTAVFDDMDEVRYPEYDSDDRTLDDMLLMSNCRHMIMANSSYSWWAAWLNQNEEKTVICPELGMWKGDFYPDEWIKIACE